MRYVKLHSWAPVFWRGDRS